VIAVEGASERVILQKVAAITGRYLDRLGGSVIETDGAGDMSAILALFGDTGIRIPQLVLIDPDAGGSRAARDRGA
jgi:putative ATP-dependent endonuclease of OLD family